MGLNLVIIGLVFVMTHWMVKISWRNWAYGSTSPRILTSHGKVSTKINALPGGARDPRDLSHWISRAAAGVALVPMYGRVGLVPDTVAVGPRYPRKMYGAVIRHWNPQSSEPARRDQKIPVENMYLSCRDHFSSRHVIYVASAMYGRHTHYMGRDQCRFKDGDECVTNGLTTATIMQCNGLEECFIDGLPDWISRCNQGSHYLELKYVCLPVEHSFNICGDQFKQRRLLPDGECELLDGFISSPGYPFWHGHHICSCTLRAQRRDAKISVSILDFQLENSENCVYDRLEFLGKYESVEERKTLCGVVNRQQVYNFRREVTLHFKSDTVFNFRGFWLHFYDVRKREGTSRYRLPKIPFPTESGSDVSTSSTAKPQPSSLPKTTVELIVPLSNSRTVIVGAVAFVARLVVIVIAIMVGIYLYRRNASSPPVIKPEAGTSISGKVPPPLKMRPGKENELEYASLGADRFGKESNPYEKIQRDSQAQFGIHNDENTYEDIPPMATPTSSSQTHLMNTQMKPIIESTVFHLNTHQRHLPNEDLTSMRIQITTMPAQSISSRFQTFDCISL
ncbi:hypothetical protein CAPTEDRAFT_217731 [Capitella teleta]|uniref:CUB domain-containing protein n=1 Tax=Capitella teleta TaxID=283909 RepID=X2AML0_CAPTE|nr:hypothetical protein CAPTEDRAFT_217731 [Capitella teleta]|eukprot:ELU00342.1 hypothetical protein CAPTEDRAFT_217731 [Capitella teleta]